MAKAKSSYSAGYSRRSAMADDILREASGSSLTMAMIGCLPDNVQQAIKSFSIRPGKQHVTFCFPFMADLLRRFKSASASAGDGCPGAADPLSPFSPGLLCDQTPEVIHGYHSLVTMAPALDRSSVPIALFTLFQRDTTEGVLRHFESLVKVVLDNRTTLSVWKMPLTVVDLSPQLQEEVTEAMAQAILDIQAENLVNTFPGKTKEELLALVKEKMVVPNLRSYTEHFQCHVKEVTGKLRALEPERFLSLLDHMRSVTCSAVDFQKADMMMKSPSTDPLIRTFWRIWGMEQIAAKVFPIALASRGVTKYGQVFYSMRGPTLEGATMTGLTHVPMKEALHSIIKCLKAQDYNSTVLPDKGEKLKGCSCSVCKSAVSKYSDLKKMGYWEPSPTELFQVQSAFYRPTPTSARPRLHHTTTPYSDALKAAAIHPHRACPSGLLPENAELLSSLRPDLRRSYVTALGALGAFHSAPPYWLQPMMHPYKLPPAPLSSHSPTSSSPSPPSSDISPPVSSASLRTPLYPIVYKPKILTQNLQFIPDK